MKGTHGRTILALVVSAAAWLVSARTPAQDAWDADEELSQAEGYELAGESDVRSASGEPGHQLRFARQSGRNQYVYWITIFPRGDRLR